MHFTHIAVCWWVVISQVLGAPRRRHPRIFWGFAGDIIESVPFLPIEINIPDTVASMFGALGSVFSYMIGFLPGGSSASMPSQMSDVDMMLRAISLDIL